jgi:hypothetical protein
MRNLQAIFILEARSKEAWNQHSLSGIMPFPCNHINEDTLKTADDSFTLLFTFYIDFQFVSVDLRCVSEKQ